MLKIRSYLLIATVVYLATLLSALPATLLIEPLSKQLGEEFELGSVSGTVWQGRVRGKLSQQNVDLTWDLHLWELFLLKAAADIYLKSSLLEVKTDISLGYKSIKISALNGVIKANSLNALLIKENIQAEIGSDIYLKKINLKRSSAQFKEANGQIDWEGGLVKVKELPDGKITLPSLLATIGLEEQGVMLRIALKEESAAELLNVELSHDGQAHLKLKERVTEYVDVPKQLQTGNPESVMFEIKRQIFETQGRF